MLKSLTDKVYPKLQETKKHLTLTAYMDNSIRLRLPLESKKNETLDDAESATLEIKAYLPFVPKSSVSSIAVSKDHVQTVAAVESSQATNKLVQLMEKLMKRVEHLEQKGEANRDHKQTGNGRQLLVCWKCQKPRQIAKNCCTNSRQQQGN